MLTLFAKLFKRWWARLRALIGPAIGMSSFIRGMTGSKGSQTFSTLKRGPAVEHYWKLGGYAANLLPERWISRVLAWNLLGRRRSGCPRTSWPSKFISYTRYRHLGNWQVLARDPDLWRGLMDDFCMFCGRE